MEFYGKCDIMELYKEKIMNRGSEWRRWELHMHTPQTKKNDNFQGSSPEEKWSKFYSDIKEYIGDGENIDKAVVEYQQAGS